jgi:RNA-binding protein
MLSGKQKREMKAAANQMKASVMIGKEGLSARVKRFIDEAFNNKTLVKVKLLDSCPDDRKMIVDKLNQIPDTQVVQLLGRTVLIYRPLKEKEEKKKKANPSG